MLALSVRLLARKPGRRLFSAQAQAVAAWRRPYEPGPLSRDEAEHFWREGFVLKRGLFAPAELQPALTAIERSVDELAESLFRGGRIRNLCRGAHVYQRLHLIEQQFPSAAVLLHKKGVLPPEFAALWSSDRLMAVAQQLLGPNIAGHPVWNLRTKVPRQEQTTVPWHQDSAYLAPEAGTVLQPTAWIPLIDAVRENGCMQLASRGHRSGLTAKHTCCVGDTWYVEVSEHDMRGTLGVDMDRDVVTQEVPMGSVLFLNNLVPHRSLENYSKNIRWSLDLRWQRPSEPNGFWGLKDSILMRTEGEPSLRVDWAGWANVERTPLQEAAVTAPTRQAADLPLAGAEDELDTTIAGPWMDRWQIVRHNHHTRSLKPNSVSWHKS